MLVGGAMRETRLDSVLSLRAGGLPAPTSAYIIARVAEAISSRPRILTVADVRIREDGQVRLIRRDRPPPFAYRAPEVIQGGEGDLRAAVFSLGVMLHELALGRAHFLRTTDLETRIAVGEEKLPALRGRSKGATRPLDNILLRATAKAPAARYASPAELRDALEGWLESELHELDDADLAAAARDAIETRPSEDRSSMPDYDAAELAFIPPPDRAPGLVKPRLDEEVVRLGDPLLRGAGAGVTDAALTGITDSGPGAETADAPGELEVDDAAYQDERRRAPKTLAPAKGRSRKPSPWLKRLALMAAIAVLLALVYQFVVRRLMGA